nr:hypothetical protein [Mycobacteroides abscessus]
MSSMIGIIADMSDTILGISVSIRSMLTTMPSMVSVISSILSRVSKIERMAQHIGMSKQCFSQYK